MKTEMNSCSIVKATPSHAQALQLRVSDLREMELWSPGRDPQKVLLQSIEASTEALAAVDETGVVAVGGYTVLGPLVVPWLMAADSLQSHRVQLMRAAHRFLRYLRETYPDAVIGNHVDRGNEPALIFLQALGAVITRTPGKADFDFFFFPGRPVLEEAK